MVFIIYPKQNFQNLFLMLVEQWAVESVQRVIQNILNHALASLSSFSAIQNILWPITKLWHFLAKIGFECSCLEPQESTSSKVKQKFNDPIKKILNCFNIWHKNRFLYWLNKERWISENTFELLHFWWNFEDSSIYFSLVKHGYGGHGSGGLMKWERDRKSVV